MLLINGYFNAVVVVDMMSKSVRIFSKIKSRVHLSLKAFPLKSNNKMQFNEQLTESNLTSTDSFSE